MAPVPRFLAPCPAGTSADARADTRRPSRRVRLASHGTECNLPDQRERLLVGEADARLAATAEQRAASPRRPLTNCQPDQEEQRDHGVQFVTDIATVTAVRASRRRREGRGGPGSTSSSCIIRHMQRALKILLALHYLRPSSIQGRGAGTRPHPEPTWRLRSNLLLDPS